MDFKSALSGDDKELELKVKTSSTDEMRDIIDRLDASVMDEPEDCTCDAEPEMMAVAMEGCKPGCECGCGEADCECHELDEAIGDYWNDGKFTPHGKKTPKNGTDRMKKYEDAAQAYVERHAADVMSDYDPSDPDFEIHYMEELYTLAHDGAMAAGATRLEASEIALTMSLNIADVTPSPEKEFEEGIINKAAKTIGGAASGARIGSIAGPIGTAAGAAIGGALGYKSAADEDDTEMNEDVDSDELSNKELENLMDNDTDRTYTVIDSQCMGKRKDYDFYEVLASFMDERDNKIYTILDVLVKDGKANIGDIDYTNANPMRAMDEFDKHVADMRQGMEIEELNEDDDVCTIEELKACDKWTRRPAKLDDVSETKTINISQIADIDNLEILHDDDVFGNKVECHDKINKKSFKIPTPDMFILETDDAAFLIKTDGTDYVRYAIRLIDDTPEDDIHADLNRMRKNAGMEMLPLTVAEDADFDMDDENNAPADPNDYDYDNDIVAFARKGHSKRQNKVTNNQGDNPMPDPDEESTLFVKESKDLFAKLSEDWDVFEDTKATSAYLNKPLRTEKEARKDIEKARKHMASLEKKNKKK